MTKRMFGLVVVLALAGTAWSDDQPEKAEKGKPAPALEVVAKSWLNTKDDKGLKLDDLKGKVVLIDFWGVW